MAKQDKPFEQSTQPENNIHHFEHLSEALKTAVHNFQEVSSPENFAAIVSALSEFGISGADLWHQVAAYSKRHPVRVALFAGLVFFAFKGLPRSSQARLLATMH